MSDWELHDFFVQVVRDYIAEKLGRQLISSQGNPHVDPSIWFVGDNVPEWVVVRAVKIPDKEAMFSSNLSAIAASCARMSTVLDRRLLTTRPAQNPTQLGVHAGQRRRQGLPDSTKPGKARFRRRPAGPCHLHGLAQPGVLLVLPTDRGLLTMRPPQDVAQVSGLVARQFRQRRSDRAEPGNAGRQLLLTICGGKGFGPAGVQLARARKRRIVPLVLKQQQQHPAKIGGKDNWPFFYRQRS